MKNGGINVRERLIDKYLEKDSQKIHKKSSNINVLLNRIKLNKKMRIEKKYIFQQLPLQV